MDYEKAYYQLFNAMTSAINELNKSKIMSAQLDNGIKILQEAQIKTEEMYIDAKRN